MDIFFVLPHYGCVRAMFGGFEISYPAFISSDASKPSIVMFPMLFITVACGGTGFSCYVSSGTTSKQLKKERIRK